LHAFATLLSREEPLPTKFEEPKAVKIIEVDASGRRLDALKPKKKPLLNFLLMGAGSMFTSMVIAGFLLGYFLDWLFETQPIFLLVCGVLGFVGGVLKVHELLGKMDLLETVKETGQTVKAGSPTLMEVGKKTLKNEK